MMTPLRWTAVVALGLAATAGALEAQVLRHYEGRWVPKELVDSAGREVRDTTVQIRAPLRPVATRLNPDERRQYGILVGMAQPSRSIVFLPGDSALIVTYNDELTFSLTLEGPPVVDTLGGQVPLEIRARWEDRNLQVEFKPVEGGGRYLETYALADSRVFLRVDARIDWGKLRGAAGWSEMYRKVTVAPPAEESDEF